MYRLLFVLTTSLLVSGCPLGLGQCTYETRTLNFEAVLAGTVHGAPDSGVASLQLAETDGSISDRILTASVHTFLAGAISDVRIVNKAGGVVLVVPGFGSSGEWSGYIRFESRSPTAREFILLEALDALEIIATIGTAPGGTLRGRFRLVEDTGWHRPYCD